MSKRKSPNLLIRHCGRLGWSLASLLVAASFSFSAVGSVYGADPGVVAETGVAASDQKAGSVLFFNVYTSDSTDVDNQNTKFAITNSAQSLSVSVRVFLVDSLSGAPASFSFCLTPNQTISFQSVDLDPNTEGYAVVVASDPNGAPIVHNHLIGDLYVKFSSGHHAGLAAIAVSARSIPTVQPTDSQIDLEFNGMRYDRMPLTLAVDNIPSRINNNDTIVFINRTGGDLVNGVGEVGNLFGPLYNDAELAHSFGVYSPRCQFNISFNANNPRTTPMFTTIIPDGRSGWLRVYSI